MKKEQKFSVKKDLPDEIESITLELEAAVVTVVDILALSNLAPSKGEAKRLIQGGGVSIDGERIADIAATVDLTEERTFKVGKRKFLKIRKA